MIWHFIDTDSSSGKFNMELDIFLSKICNDNEVFFRLYRWNPDTISLGANQNINEIDTDKCITDNIEIVKRPTGGRAILHAEELTYSMVVPLSFGLSAKDIYNKVSNTLSAALAKYDSKLSSVELENLQPDFKQLLNNPSGALCFASTAKSEVKYNGKKLIGSAQRKMNTVVLQHGSILCGKKHNRLPDYLLDKSHINELKTELSDKTTEIETILNKKIDYSLLAYTIKKQFEIDWKFNFMDSTTLIISKFNVENKSII
jgi:lipoyl(octanoyl) transferase